MPMPARLGRGRGAAGKAPAPLRAAASPGLQQQSGRSPLPWLHEFVPLTAPFVTGWTGAACNQRS